METEWTGMDNNKRCCLLQTETVYWLRAKEFPRLGDFVFMTTPWSNTVPSQKSRNLSSEKPDHVQLENLNMDLSDTKVSR